MSITVFDFNPKHFHSNENKQLYMVPSSQSFIKLIKNIYAASSSLLFLLPDSENLTSVNSRCKNSKKTSKNLNIDLYKFACNIHTHFVCEVYPVYTRQPCYLCGIE